MTLEAGLHSVTAEEADAVRAEAARIGAPVCELSTRGATGRAGDFGAVRRTFPLDPPLHSDYSYDAMTDSLWQGLHDLGVDLVVIVWEGSTKSHWMLTGVLEDVAESLGQAKYTRGTPTTVCVYVVQDPPGPPPAWRTTLVRLGKRLATVSGRIRARRPPAR